MAILKQQQQVVSLQAEISRITQELADENSRLKLDIKQLQRTNDLCV